MPSALQFIRSLIISSSIFVNANSSFLAIMQLFVRKNARDEEGGVPIGLLDKKPSRLNIFVRSKSKDYKLPLDDGPVPTLDDDRNEEPESSTAKSSMSFFSRNKKDKSQKKIAYDSFGGQDVLVLVTEKTKGVPPLESPDDVVVKIEASTVSINDCIARRGVCFSVADSFALPATPGMDLVGTIVSVGANVQGFKVGDRVAALVRTGGNARYCVVSYHSLVSVPRNLDAADAVAMVSVFMTAYQALNLIDTDMKGTTVLVTGGMGPVEQALIQLSLRAGATQVYYTAPEHHHIYVKSVLGSIPLCPDESTAFVPSCQDGLESSAQALKEIETLLGVGMPTRLHNESRRALGAPIFGAPMFAIWPKEQYFTGATRFYDVWESFQSDPDKFKADLASVFELLSKREIKPHIAKRIALADVQGAQTILEVGPQPRGIIVCFPWRRRKVNIRPGREQPEA